MVKLWAAVALICCGLICCVTAEIVWIDYMQSYQIYENMALGVSTNQSVKAVQMPQGTSSNIRYGFYKPNSDELQTTSTYFSIDSLTGEVFTYGNQLDYDKASGNRDLTVTFFAKTVDGSESSFKTTSIVILDVNDVPPKFTNDSLSVFIEENTEVGAGFVALKDIFITDNDTFVTSPLEFIEVSVEYCVVLGRIVDCAHQFDIIRTSISSPKFFTGDFTINATLDYEQASRIQVQLLARDGVHNVTTDVVVNVQDKQDLPPRWTVVPKESFVNEGVKVGELSVIVEAEDQDSQPRPIFYSFTEGQTIDGIDIRDIFVINDRTGEITNVIVLDLEDEKYFRNYKGKVVRRVWPILLKACEIINENPLQVGTGGMECAVTQDIEIIIEDVNDNRPKFSSSIYRYVIREGIPNGDYLYNPEIRITDRDTDIYNKFNTSFVPESAEFALSGPTRANPIIEIKNTSLIDYDRGPKQYTLYLRTVDIDEPSFVSTATVIINVTDVNDNSPRFVPESYNVRIPEDSQQGFEVVQVTSIDIDSGDFGTAGILYILEGANKHRFHIDELSGQITVEYCETYGVEPCLDYDTQPITYFLSVRAVDTKNEPGARDHTVTVAVEVTDVNDNPPIVGDYSRFITEGEIRFSPDLFVKATDRDSTNLEYSIRNQSPGKFWAIDKSTGLIFVNKSGQGIKFSDGDSVGRFIVEVAVTDGKFTAISNVHITVIDINDNAPTFFPRYYEETIDETTPGGTFVLRVSATDADDPTSENGRFSYNIASGNVGGRFVIDKKSGDIYTADNAVFNIEIIKQYNMTVIAIDDGKPQLEGNATVVVKLRDTNNKDPFIDPSLQEFTVYDNVNIGYSVGYVGASDPDINALLEFEWGNDKEANSDEGFVVDPINGFDYRNLFRIERTTGRIFVNEPLDSRRASLVSYSVIVRDVFPTPKQNGTGTVIFYIKPFNTRPPQIEPFQSPIYINEEQPIGSGVISLIAQDDNGIRIFELIEQPDDNFFAISPTTGSVSILNRIDYDDIRMINDSYFIATVTDTGEPELTSSASVSVIFRNINDNFPQFVERDNINRPKNIYTSRIPENSPDGTPIATVYAFDRDRPDNNSFHEIRYFMDDDRFDVDPISGEIFVRLRNGAVLDREQNSRINTQVVARDNPNGTPQNQRAAAVIVTLTDVNDNPPKFSRDEYYVQIYETIAVGTDILQLFSTDRDIGDNARSYYYKVADMGTDHGDFFDVRQEAGRVYLKSSVLRNVGTYVFYVQAVDLFGTGFATNASVTVDVLPSANAPPVWVIPPIDNMTIYVLEEQYKGMLVYDVSARDVDTGDNGVVDYSFIYDGETTQSTPEFNINRVTGVIHAEIVYDRELVDRYVLLLNASDRGETRLGTTRFLTVVILDVNDNPPKFAEPEIEIRVAENRPLGEIRKIPTATDIDLNPTIVYHIISGNGDGTFELDPDTRMLYLRKPLDREVKSIYYLDVQASNDEPDFTVITDRKKRATDPSILTVKVLVGDINDEAPRFLQDEYYGCVSARAPFESHIMTIQAIDSDAIGTGVVRYRVTDGHMIGNTTLFGIHEKFGIITNRMLMRRYADSTFFVTVNARDREDIDTAESANTVAKIFVNQPGNEVKLLITQNTGEVRLYKTQIQSILEQASDLDYVCINDIQDHVIDSAGSVSTLWSDVYVTGVRKNVVNGVEKYTMLSSTELMNIINTERYARKSDFDLLYIREVEAASSSQEIELEDQAVLIIVIIIAILIFLVIIFCILAFMCIRAAKRQKKELLLHKTHATPAPIVQQEPVVVEPIIYDNRMFVTEEQPPVQVVEQQEIVEHDPVHVQYAVVQKRSPSPQFIEQSVHQYVEDDQDAIVVELKDDEPQPRDDVYQPEPEYTIETEVVEETQRF
ncbi:Protocadherin-16 [Mactra antiquata]